jgi:hypothetical protein
LREGHGEEGQAYQDEEEPNRFAEIAHFVTRKSR